MAERDDEDMTKPVTRGELRAELAEMRAEMRKWAGALNDRIERGERLIMRHVSEEIARCTNAILEAVRGQIGAVDDKYKDLPRRVARLERARKLKG
ncbi:MAG TPA: hypothetical protein VGF94_01105 [Kofleriaceae bacterium]|jgi:hypothetical protein